MKWCLSKTQLECLLAYIFKNEADSDVDNIISIYERAQYWEESIVIINYLLTQLIQREIKKGSLNKDFLAKIYDISSTMDITLDEIDSNFIDFIFNHTRFSKEINENLIILKEKYVEYDYAHQIRY